MAMANHASPNASFVNTYGSHGRATSPSPQKAKLPLRAFRADYFPEAFPIARYLFPIFTVLAIATCLGYIANFIVTEREKHIVAGLQMMGMGPFSNWLAWWITYVLIHTLSAIVLTAGATMCEQYPASSPVLLFITIELFVFAAVGFALVIASLIRKPRTAQGVVVLGHLSSFGLFAINVAILQRKSAFFEYLLCLNCFVAGSIGILDFTSAAFNGRPVDIFGVADGFVGSLEPHDAQTPLIMVWIFLVVDAILYVGLAHYIEEVTHGGRSLFFPFEPSKKSVRAAYDVELTQSLSSSSPLRINDSLNLANEAGTTDGSSSIHAPNAEIVVKMRNVSRSFTKGFFSSAPPVHALTNLTVSMAKDEITALLGQNGAGKTTAISILTGLFPATSGSATVFGLDSYHQRDSVRRRTGVCPQHDLLFDDLTVLEHVKLYGKIKGVPPARVAEEARKWLGMVGLDEKLNSRAKTLSGGQKRKLSVAIALVGEPPFIVLDEPTAGMDPESRRAIWSLILSVRAGRSLVLTTHFMDEADALADRIAIIASGAPLPDGTKSGGTLRCMGTALELKTKFGTGYHLRFALNAEACGVPCDADGLIAFVKGALPSAYEEESKPTELCVGLPTAQLPHFAPLFDALTEEVLQKHGAKSYGVSLPTLQEVFLSIVEEKGINYNVSDTTPMNSTSAPDTTAPQSERVDGALLLPGPLSDAPAPADAPIPTNAAARSSSARSLLCGFLLNSRCRVMIGR